VLDDLYNTFWQNTYLSYYLLTWVRYGKVGFEEKAYLTKKQYIHCILIILCRGNSKNKLKDL